MEIVLATRNKKKVEEMARILEGMDVVIRTMDDFPSCPEVEEDKDTFEGNAVKKAISIAECTNKPAVADDSGLEVYALNGAPGIMSARYSGENACDVTNIEKLLVEMRDIPDEKRGARFVCCIALAFPDTPPTPPLNKGGQGGVVTFLGFAEGRIGRETHGRMGFGYDPVFYPSGYEMTFAEMTPGEKDALSHRGKALEKLKDYLVRSLPR
ncbi:MAG: non-canonical purine NTP pyrophosphatase, RdgB/HAM1 family [Nitrospirae bacterium GWB2_47_37]|nr:MAG: non-canonical purine NTP pyrophosphatase, RdgB/HAM1 family [Nitrospirae bacterium GWB2_47_37]